MRSAAYDMTQFMNQRDVQPNRVVILDNLSQKKEIKAYRVRLIVISAFLLVLMYLTVYNNMLLDVTQAKIIERNSEINRLENEYSYLSCALENLISLRNAADYAENEIGLVKVSPSQIEYINLQNTNWIVDGESAVNSMNIFMRIWNNLTEFFG